jgi:hypothetical protein
LHSAFGQAISTGRSGRSNDRVAGLPQLASHAAERGGEKNLAATFPILPHAEGRIARPLRHRQLGIASGFDAQLAYRCLTSGDGRDEQRFGAR